MKRIAYGALLCVLAAAAACSRNDDAYDEQIGTSSDELKYNGVGPLIRKSFSETNETNRQNNTQAYYDSIQVSTNGTTNIGSISAKLATLGAFKTNYGFSANGVKTFYYNRGDLGIGREMHCVDKFTTTGQVACYVKNFAAGDANTEFQFGMSQDVAFKNMEAGNAFATVAMVFRNSAASNKVFFVVYGADEKLVKKAPLDRHGLNFALGKRDSTGALGTPGVNFNNHIPSNCLNCHGGTYNPGSSGTNPSVSGGLFLPFDLDAFDYQNARADRTRAAQEPAFKTLNTMARSVASQVGGTGAEVVRQIDGWYANGTYNSSYIPPGWNNSAAERSVYTSVVRGACRGCHMTSPLSFATAASFSAPAVVADLCSLTMPHALQTTREFWQSTKPLALESYFRGIGQAAAADTLKNCGPKSVVTLDPHRINVATRGLF